MVIKSIIASVICLALTTSAYATSMSDQDNHRNSSYDISDEYYTQNTSGEIINVRQSRPIRHSTPKPHRSYKDTLEPEPEISHHLFYLGVYGGYGVIDGAYKNDGQFVQERLATGAAYTSNRFIIGAEFGFQSGNTMHLSIPDDIVTETGGLQWLATLKPLVDFMIASKILILPGQPFYATLKGGIAYRQLQLDDRNSSRYYLNRVSPEIQAGISVGVTRNMMVTAFYQGIFSDSDVDASVNSFGNGTISNIPTQQAGFIGIEISL